MFLYVTTSGEAVSAVLMCDREQQQIPVYYHSHRLQGPELRYPPIEKIVHAVIHASLRFNAYFLTHPIKVLTVEPLRGILHRPDLSGRLAKWAIELSAFDISYIPATEIKGQAVADFLVELTHIYSTIPWIVEVDGSSCNTGSRIGIKIQSPDGRNYEHSFHLLFPETYNVAEYEAVLHGLKMVHGLGAANVILHTDSQLIAHLASKEFTAKEPQIARYAEVFEHIQIEQIPQIDKNSADALTKLVSAWDGDQREISVDSILHPTVKDVLTITSSIPNESNWQQPILDYIKRGTLPEDKGEARKLHHKAAKF